MAKRPVQKYDFTPFGKAIKSAAKRTGTKFLCRPLSAGTDREKECIDVRRK